MLLCFSYSVSPLVCFTSGRSRTLDSFYAGNRRNPYKTLFFQGFTSGDSIAWKKEENQGSTHFVPTLILNLQIVLLKCICCNANRQREVISPCDSITFKSNVRRGNSWVFYLSGIRSEGKKIGQNGKKFLLMFPNEKINEKI